MGTKLFVGNLSFNTTQNQLQDAFSQHGVVVEVALMLDRETGRSRGFAFVTMDTVESAQAAIQAMSGAQLDGRSLTVNEAKPKEERPRSGGYGGGGGQGACLFSKRLEKGRFVWPAAKDGKIALSPAQLAMLLEG